MDNAGVYVSVSDEKRNKAKRLIKETQDEILTGNGWIGCKGFESSQGFLLYVTGTYPSMVTYMKGFHLTLDGWRKGQNSEGWKYLNRRTGREWRVC